jgi:hypothetical protein
MFLADDSYAVTPCVQSEVHTIYLCNKSIEYTTEFTTRELKGVDKCGDNSATGRITLWKTLGIS